MLPHRSRAPRAGARGLTLSLLALALLVRPAPADEAGKATPGALDKPAPANVEDLKAIQAAVKQVVARVKPCVVGIVVGEAQGSGVIINADGYVLTAGHVSGRPNRDCTIVLPDGKTVKGQTLGHNVGIDSGMVKILEGTNWPHVEMADSTALKKGQWCVTMGHPGGYHRGRPPVVRLGRLLEHNRFILRTDCTLVGGDSGGPLFDLSGKVIGIHSRIGGEISSNIHVPVNTYRDSWDRLAKSDSWGGRLGRPASDAWMGFEADRDARECKIGRVEKDSPAEKFGLKKGDVITKFDNQPVESFDDLIYWLMNKKPDEEVAVVVNRDGETLSLKIKLSKRSA